MMEFVRKYFSDERIVGAEVGVFMGEHACEILGKMPNVEKLYLVDPYENYEGYWHRRMDEVLQGLVSAQKRLDGNGIDPSRYEWVIAHFSASVIPEVLDFIYIDGNHTYNAVKFDILESKKIVRCGGVIGGHDYRRNSGVAKAVIEVYGEGHQFKDADWWVIHR